MKPPDLSRLKAALGAAEHKPWCRRSRAAVVAAFAAPAAVRLPPCTCGLDPVRERVERIEGMAMDAGRDAN